MGHDLETLLDVTGIGDMAGTQHEKTASSKEEPFDLKKLASQCREAAEATESHREARGRDLVEKTAAVAVISRTIDEINGVIGDPAEKIASDDRTHGFIAAAIERGHSPEEVAVFLKNAGLISAVRDAAKGARAGLRTRAGGRLSQEGRNISNLGKREYGDILRSASRSGDLNKQNRIVERLRRKLGDKEAAKVLKDSGADISTPSAKAILTEAPSKKMSLSTGGGKSYSLSEKNTKRVKRYGVPAAAGGGAVAVAGRDGGGDDKGFTVIKS